METNASEHEFLKPEVVAQLLRCGRTKTYELLRSNSIPSYFVGRNRIVRRCDVIAWLAGQRYRPGDAREDPLR